MKSNKPIITASNEMAYAISSKNKNPKSSVCKTIPVIQGYKEWYVNTQIKLLLK